MNEQAFELAAKLVPSTYIKQASDAIHSRQQRITHLIEQRKWPSEGWDDATIELCLSSFSLMDSNNFPGNVGVGEREARIASSIVSRRHFGLGHGVGRSGDVTAVQPKAAGSSLMVQLTNSFLLDVIRNAGVRSASACVLLPVATGMSIVMTLLTLRPHRPSAKYILWPRIDQKSCFKSMVTAGFIPIVVENTLEGDELRTDVAAVEKKIEELGADSVLCVLSTTSCFAPRVPDRVQDLARICKRHNIPHVINNAYGVQAERCMHLIEEAHRVGRVDAFIQSTDKNFLVPVGGGVVAGFNKAFIDEVSKTYPGRASAAPTMDVFITLLSLGVFGYNRLLAERKDLLKVLSGGLVEVAAEHGGRLLQTPHNPISLAMSLPSLTNEQAAAATDGKSADNATFFGSMLFQRCVSGTRVVAPGIDKTIGGHTFTNWGAHHDHYPCSYLTVAAAIGMTRHDVDTFLARLRKAWRKLERQRLKEEGVDIGKATTADGKLPVGEQHVS